jgi:hypothetical protein
MVKKRIGALIFALAVLAGAVAGCQHSSQCGFTGNGKNCNFSTPN